MNRRLSRPATRFKPGAGSKTGGQSPIQPNAPGVFSLSRRVCAYTVRLSWLMVNRASIPSAVHATYVGVTAKNISRRAAITSAASVGLATLAAGVAGPTDRRSTIAGAWAVHRGEHTKLVVEGIVCAGRARAWFVLVRPAVPQGINAEILILMSRPRPLPYRVCGQHPATCSGSLHELRTRRTSTRRSISLPAGRGRSCSRSFDTGMGPDTKGRRGRLTE